MLQIISGKFFSQESVYRTVHRGTLYTNYESHEAKRIETVAGSLFPSTAWSGLRTIMAEITEQQEAVDLDGSPGMLIAVGSDDLMDDMAAILSFVLNITCTPDPDLARRLVSTQRPSIGSFEVPQKYLSQTFDVNVLEKDSDALDIARFLKDLQGLERKTFEGVMRSIRRFVVGTHRIYDDIDVAYALLVASLEALAQQFDAFDPAWSDYEERKRSKFDRVLENAPVEVADQIRQVILDIEHAALGRRYRDFVSSHLSPDFFRREAVGAINPIAASDLSFALKRAYSIRSEYIHTLKPLPDEISKIPTHAEMTLVEGQPALTFQGLTRLARHVINQVVANSPKVDRENYDYRRALPNIVRFRLDPQHWLWNADGFSTHTSWSYLSAFLEQVSALIADPLGPKLTNISPVIEKAETFLAKGIEQEVRRPMFALYYIFHTTAPVEMHRPIAQEIIEKYIDDLNSPSIIGLAFQLIYNDMQDWDLSKQTELYAAYLAQRYKKMGLTLTRLLESGLTLSLAERFRAAGDNCKARDLICQAVENFPSHTGLRAFEASLGESLESIDWRSVMGLPRIEAPKAVEPDVSVLPEGDGAGNQFATDTLAHASAGDELSEASLTTNRESKC